MDQTARIAFVIAQAACAQAEAAAMTAANQADAYAGRPPSYGFLSFMDLQNKYLIGHNAVIEYMR